jgi:hypothetical protein
MKETEVVNELDRSCDKKVSVNGQRINVDGQRYYIVAQLHGEDAVLLRLNGQTFLGVKD